MQERSSKAIFNFLASFRTLRRLKCSDKCVSDIALVMVCNDNVNKFHQTHSFTQREALLRTLKKGVLIFVQILTRLLVGFVTHLKVC